MTIISAYPFGDGIQINRQIGPDQVRADLVMPGDPDWLEAVAAAGGIEALPPAPLPPTLAQARASAVAAINAVRGEMRSRFLTQLPGQDMVYLEKVAEARDWLAASASGAEPNPAEFPHLSAEVGVTAPDADAVAQVYLNLAAQFRHISAVIEGCAMRALVLADAAETPNAALQVGGDFPAALAAALAAIGIVT